MRSPKGLSSRVHEAVRISESIDNNLAELTDLLGHKLSQKEIFQIHEIRRGLAKMFITLSVLDDEINDRS